ncbi:hypothetical protein VTK56DRAFT_426 [Thermocarpiscus australiensis]
MASPLHRHQSSLEGVINFSTEPPLETEVRTKARRRFFHIINHFEDLETERSNQYNRPRLVRLTYEFALSEASKDNVLRAFFRAVALPIAGDENVDLADKNIEDGIRSALIGFAEHLFENFFLPLKASGRRTPLAIPCMAFRSSRIARSADVCRDTADCQIYGPVA